MSPGSDTDPAESSHSRACTSCLSVVRYDDDQLPGKREWLSSSFPRGICVQLRLDVERCDVLCGDLELEMSRPRQAAWTHLNSQEQSKCRPQFWTSTTT